VSYTYISHRDIRNIIRIADRFKQNRDLVLYLINNLITENVGNIFTIARAFFTRVTIALLIVMTYKKFDWCTHSVPVAGNIWLLDMLGVRIFTELSTGICTNLSALVCTA